MWLVKNFSSSIGKKGLMAASGLFLSLFLLAHMFGNFTSFFGRDAFNTYASRLHALGLLIALFEVLLLVVLLVHVVTAVVLYLQNLASRPTRYAVGMKRGRSLAARLMPYTGLLTLVFLVIHLANFHFARTAQPEAEVVRRVLRQPGFALFYMLSVAGVALHVSHGLWSMFQSLGCNHPKYNPLLEKGAVALSLLIGAVFFLIPLLTLTFEGFLR